MLTLARFKAMTDSYGADPRRWPPSLRSEAEALLAASAEARAQLEAAREVDEAIAQASASNEARLGGGAERDAALARLRSGVAARIAASSTPRAATPRAASPRAASPRGVGTPRGGPSGGAWQAILWSFGRPGIIAVASAAIVAGLLIGSLYGPPSASTGAFDDLLTALIQPPIQGMPE